MTDNTASGPRFPIPEGFRLLQVGETIAPGDSARAKVLGAALIDTGSAGQPVLRFDPCEYFRPLPSPIAKDLAPAPLKNLGTCPGYLEAEGAGFACQNCGRHKAHHFDGRIEIAPIPQAPNANICGHSMEYIQPDSACFACLEDSRPQAADPFAEISNKLNAYEAAIATLTTQRDALLSAVMKAANVLATCEGYLQDCKEKGRSEGAENVLLGRIGSALLLLNSPTVQAVREAKGGAK